VERHAKAVTSSEAVPLSADALLLEELTPREIEVVRLIAEGCSTKEVAGRLGITFKTAVCHRTRVMQKLDIHETASLTRYAIRCGLIKP
jgi:DNA-binding NarL/FixJ family response regulator